MTKESQETSKNTGSTLLQNYPQQTNSCKTRQSLRPENTRETCTWYAEIMV